MKVSIHQEKELQLSPISKQLQRYAWAYRECTAGKGSSQPRKSAAAYYLSLDKATLRLSVFTARSITNRIIDGAACARAKHNI